MSLSRKMLLAVGVCTGLVLATSLVALYVPMHQIEVRVRGMGHYQEETAFTIPIPGPPVIGLLPEGLRRGLALGDRGWVSLMRAGCRAMNSAQDHFVLRVGECRDSAFACLGPDCMPCGMLFVAPPISVIDRFDLGLPVPPVPAIVRCLIHCL